MKPATAARVIGLLLALASASAGTGANGAEPGWYVGGSAGQSRARVDDQRITNGLLGSGLATTSITDDERDVGFKLFGGYQFNRYLSVESGYFDLGKFGFVANTLPPGSLAGTLKLRGVNLDVVGTLPITERFSAFGRVGVDRAHARDAFSGSGSVIVTDPYPREWHTDVKAGLGLQFALTEGLTVRTEVERYRVRDAVGNKGDVDLVSVGLTYHFGAKAPSAVVRPPPPAPLVVAAAPPSAPAPLPPAPPAPPTRFTFAADSLFDFDKSTLKPSGTASLDKLANDLRGTRFDRIDVTGHTDRFGPHAYNQALSTHRAEAVRKYLVRAGIDEGRIVAKGVDGADPKTRPGECVGKKSTPRLIACLQPDRRVDVEVSGVR